MEKNRLAIIIAAAVIFTGCGLLVAALIIPPPGEIDHSVLVAFGEMSTFAGALMGVHFRNNSKKQTNEKDR